MTLHDIRRDAMTIGFSGNISHLNRLASKVKDEPWRVYEFMDEYGIVTDSVIREKLFTYIANKYYNGNYDKIYKQWLNS